MQFSGKRASLLATGLVVALGATACGGSSDKGAGNTPKGKAGGTFRLGIVEPTAIDPYNSQESEGILVTKALFVGLVNLNDKAELTPGVATKWAANTDCTQWTFNLNKSAKFSNGEAVTAKSFIDGWTRSGAKAAASDVAYHMAGVAGFDELNGGKATTFSGLSAPDPETFVVKLNAADCEFDKKTLQPVMSPVPTTAGDAKNKAFNDMPIGNGPFKLAAPWAHNTSIKLVRNDAYWGTKAFLDAVNISILNSETAATLEYNGFKADQFDYARIPTELLPQAKATYEPQGSFLNEVKFGINYLLPMDTTSPLNTPDARKAISYAIDRDKIISGVFKGFQTKATSIVPPSFKEYFQDGVCSSCVKQDVAKAKEFAAKAGLKPGTTLNFGYNTGGGHDAWVQAVAAQLKTVLGLNVNINGVPFKELLQNEKKKGTSGIFRSAWGADYPTPDNFLFPLMSTKAINPDAAGTVQGDNASRYSNPAFDALLVKERAAKTTDERKPIIQEAEKLAIDTDQALIPLWYRTQYRVFNSKKFANVAMDFNEDPTLSLISLK